MRRRRNELLALVAIASLAGCGGGDKQEISIGLVSPLQGALAAVGASFERVATAAVDEINTRGGVDGHPLRLIVRDTETNAEVAADVLREVIDLGAVGVIGPATSDAVAACYEIAETMQVPIISPSSTEPSLALAPDGGYMFRNVPNDDIQGIAMAYYLTEVADPAVTNATLVFEDTSYGNGLADAFEAAFECNGGTVDGRITFVQNIVADVDADAVVSELVTAAPSTVVMVALEQDGLRIVQRWDADGSLPNMKWFMTDGLRSAGFLANLPASMVGNLGTAPTFPTLGDAYSVLEESYNERYDDDITEQVFAPNVWDGVYLLAAALVAQESDSEFDGVFGGALLRDKLTEVSRGPGPVIHAGLWRDLSSSIKAGNPVDYDGASGPNDFDDNGEAVGPYEVWQIVDNGAGGQTFQQVLFLEARDIVMLGVGCN